MGVSGMVYISTYLDMIRIDRIDALHFDSDQWNSCNHQELAPEGYSEDDYINNSKSFDYSKWYKRDLDPYLLAPPLALITLAPKIREQICELNTLLQFRDFSARDALIIDDIVRNSALATVDLKSGPFFIRCDECSTKDVHSYRPVPYANVEQFLRDIVLSKRLSAFLNDGRPGQNFTIIITKWLPCVNMEREFRVFVKNKRVTAISQYVWHKVLSWTPTEELFAHMIQYVDNLYNQELFPENSSVDLYVHDDNSTIKLVEIGPFGGYTGCGSCLFHWVRDNDIMNSDSDDCVVRLLQ